MNYMKEFDSVTPSTNSGKILLTGFPGFSTKKFNQKELINTFASLKKINCHTIISLTKDREFTNLFDKEVFKKRVIEVGFVWHHLPIQDYKIPNKKFLIKWKSLSPKIQLLLLKGNTVCIHCMGGRGRSGIVASMLLIDLGEKNIEAIARVRNSREGAIENTLQENFVKNYKTVV